MRKPGRPTLYKPEYAEQARKMALGGFIDKQMADVFNVSVRQFHDWKKANPEFKAALMQGKDMADAEVSAALYQRAIGWGKLPPDTMAIMYWLNNRQKLNWRHRQSVEHSGADGGPVEVNVNIDAIRERITSRISGIASRIGTNGGAVRANGNGATRP